MGPKERGIQRRLRVLEHAENIGSVRLTWRYFVIFEPLDFISRLAALVPCCEAVSSQIIKSRSDTD